MATSLFSGDVVSLNNPLVFISSTTADPDIMKGPFSLSGDIAGACNVQWMRSEEVACPQCWLPGSMELGFSW